MDGRILWSNINSLVSLLLSNYSLVTQRLTSCVSFFKKKKKIIPPIQSTSFPSYDSFYYSMIIFPDYWTNSYKVASFVKRQITNSLLRKRFTFWTRYSRPWKHPTITDPNKNPFISPDTGHLLKFSKTTSLRNSLCKLLCLITTIDLNFYSEIGIESMIHNE